LLAVIVALLVGGILFTITALRQDPIEAISGDRVINTLFIIEDAGKPLASYVLMYYSATKRAAIFDIPGELGLIIKNNRVSRIDAIYDPQRAGAFESEVENLLGVEVNFTLVITLENLGKLVDLIEGVEIFIPSWVAVYDEASPALFPSGVTRLDGDKAKVYITYRLLEEDGDIVTFRRQRFFLGLIKRLGEKNDALKNPAVSRMFQSFIKTGMNQRTQMRLFDELAVIETDRININSVGGSAREVSGQVLLFPHFDGSLIKQIVIQVMGVLTRQVEGSLTDRVFTVEILNGTGAPGLAGRTADLLRSFGYDVISIGNADRNDYTATEIIDHSGYEEMVKNFADIIRCTNIRFEDPVPEEVSPDMGMQFQNFEYKSDFTLIIGKDFNGRYVNEG
jgi:anionic cell wall polymer biosynthesis LytR-Cps2A-Psr (LCP) family protein